MDNVTRWLNASPDAQDGELFSVLYGELKNPITAATGPVLRATKGRRGWRGFN